MFVWKNLFKIYYVKIYYFINFFIFIKENFNSVIFPAFNNVTIIENNYFYNNTGVKCGDLHI